MITRSRGIIFPEWGGSPIEEEQDGWPVIQRFEPSETYFQVGLVDLSHRPKAFIHGPGLRKLGEIAPGQAVWTGQSFACGLRPGEGVVFDLTGPIKPAWPNEYYTDMTEGWVFFGLFGPRALDVMARLVILDVARPDKNEPFYLITNSHGLRVHILNPKGPEPGVFLACNRSQGQNLFDACVRSGRHLGLKLVGLEAFLKWFTHLGF